MKRIFLLPLVALLVAAASAESLDLVRQGNAAFENQDFHAALALYEQAAARITDPGLVAQNQGAALFRLGRFREAELHYRRALEDASGPRRGRLLFDLGNSLLRQSDDSDAPQLADAVACYRQALELADPDLADDVQHNLELAKLLWLKARAIPPKKDKTSPDTKEPKKKELAKKEEPKEVTVGKEPGPETKTQKQPANIDPKKGGKSIETNQAPPPGSNHSLQAIPDQDELVPLPAEDTLRHLKQADDKIQRERREHLKRSAPLPPRGVMDW